MASEFLTVREAAQEFGTSNQQLHNLLSKGKLNRFGARPILLSRAELVAWRKRTDRGPTVIVPGDGDPRHGTENGYGNRHCHCPDCREAHRVHIRAQYAKPRTLEPGSPHHGTRYARVYYHCACEICKPPRLVAKPIPDWLWTQTTVAFHLGLTNRQVGQLVRRGDRLIPFTRINGREYFLRDEVIDLPPTRVPVKALPKPKPTPKPYVPTAADREAARMRAYWTEARREAARVKLEQRLAERTERAEQMAEARRLPFVPRLRGQRA